jgi:flagellar protein FlgJ
VPDLSFYEKATAEATMSRSILPQAHVEQFMSRMLPAAQRASQASGVPAQLIMAQAALESGWGKREIRTGDGKTSFNVFGIKADKSWKGPVVEAATTEYVNGVAQKTQARFRAYSSYDESFADYARFMTSNPRYANVLATPDPAQAAHGLQRAGYATDPNYGGKLVRIMAKMT